MEKSWMIDFLQGRLVMPDKKILILLRGSPGAGKSTWVEDNNLSDKVISPDEIRLTLNPPMIGEEGKWAIIQDTRAWPITLERLEERMKKGLLTIIDGMHKKIAHISAYKPIVDKYDYKVIILDFSDVPIEVAKERNLKRPEYKHVPEYVIDDFYSTPFVIPSWVVMVKPGRFKVYL